MSILNKLINRRGLGWKPAPPDPRDYVFHPSDFPGGRHNEPPNLEAYEPPIADQRSNNDCVAQALADAVYTVENLQHGNPTPGSKRFLYYNARRLHNAHRWDRGTSIRLACASMARIGIPDDEYCAWTTNDLEMNKQPGWKSYMMAHPRSGGEYYRILASGDMRLKLICAAIDEGYPVIFGTAVDKAFSRDDGPEVILGPVNQLMGRHCMMWSRYRTLDGRLQFRTRNSWGTDWRDDGRAWMSEDYVAWSQTSSLTIVKGWRGLG